MSWFVEDKCFKDANYIYGNGEGAIILLSWYHRWCNKCLCQTQTQKILRRKHFSLHRIDQLFIVLTRPGKNKIIKTPISFSVHLVLLCFKSHHGRKLLKELTQFGCCNSTAVAVAVVGAGLLQMIIRRDQALQMIIQSGRPLVNCHLEWPSSFWSGLPLAMIIPRGQPLANDHPQKPASCKWSSRGSSHLQMIIRRPHHPSHLCQDSDSTSRTFLEQFVLVFLYIMPE